MGKTRGLRKYHRKTFKRKTKLSHLGRFLHKRKSRKSKKISRRDKHRYRTVRSTSRMKNRKTRRKMSGGSPVVGEYYIYSYRDVYTDKDIDEILIITNIRSKGQLISILHRDKQTTGILSMSISEFNEGITDGFILGPLKEEDKNRRDLQNLRNEYLEREQEEVAPPSPTPPPEEQLSAPPAPSPSPEEQLPALQPEAPSPPPPDAPPDSVSQVTEPVAEPKKQWFPKTRFTLGHLGHLKLAKKFNIKKAIERGLTGTDDPCFRRNELKALVNQNDEKAKKLEKDGVLSDYNMWCSEQTERQAKRRDERRRLGLKPDLNDIPSMTTWQYMTDREKERWPLWEIRGESPPSTQPKTRTPGRR